MHATVQILNRPVRVEWSKAAELALSESAKPLVVEMELYFSCLIRKKVRFNEQAHSRNVVPVNDRLGVAFRPVMTKACGVHDEHGEAPLEDFPIANPAAFVPHWLRIDYRSGEWQGEFGFV